MWRRVALGASLSPVGRLLTWPDTGNFFEHVLKNTPPEQPLEIAVAETDLDIWNDLSAKIGAGKDRP